jgi:hypothetical protein
MICDLPADHKSLKFLIARLQIVYEMQNNLTRESTALRSGMFSIRQIDQKFVRAPQKNEPLFSLAT